MATQYDNPPPYAPTDPIQPNEESKLRGNQRPPPYPYMPQPPQSVHVVPPVSSYIPQYGSTVTVSPTEVIVVGGCPACKIGILEEDFTCLGICCAIFFFPLGLLCCLLMRQRRCANCGVIYG